VLRDETGGRIHEAVRRQATLDHAEQREILTDRVRLDGWVSYAYRALKSDRDGRPLQRRLDRTLDGDPAAIKETFRVVDRQCREYDAATGKSVLGDIVDEWRSERELFAS
jgi:hypothetical protein